MKAKRCRILSAGNVILCARGAIEQFIRNYDPDKEAIKK
jgi:hypothetical protein